MIGFPSDVCSLVSELRTSLPPGEPSSPAAPCGVPPATGPFPHLRTTRLPRPASRSPTRQPRPSFDGSRSRLRIVRVIVRTVTEELRGVVVPSPSCPWSLRPDAGTQTGHRRCVRSRSVLSDNERSSSVTSRDPLRPLVSGDRHNARLRQRARRHSEERSAVAPYWIMGGSLSWSLLAGSRLDRARSLSSTR